MILDIDIRQLGVPPMSFWTKRYSNDPHCDLMQVFSNHGSFKFEKLNDAAHFILGEKKIDVDVKTFADRIKQGKGGEIAEYCKQDTALTFKLFQRADKYLF